MLSPDSHTFIHLFDLMESASALLPGSGLLGMGTDGEPYILNMMAAETSHILISGEQGSGKTALLRSLATSLAWFSRQAEVQLVLIDTDLGGGNDPRGSLLPVSYFPHTLAGMIVSVEDALAAFTFLVEEMVYRAEQAIDRPRIVVFVDHFLPLLVEGGVFVEDAVQRLIREGATAGIHLVVATRRSEIAALDPVLREAWPVRIVGRQPTASEEDENAVAPGEFSAHVGSRKTTFHAAYVEDYDLDRCLEELRRYRPPSLIARPLPASSSG